MARRATRLTGGRRVGRKVVCTEKYWHRSATNRRRDSRGKPRSLPACARLTAKRASPRPPECHCGKPSVTVMNRTSPRRSVSGYREPAGQPVEAVVPALLVILARLRRGQQVVSKRERCAVAARGQLDGDEAVVVLA